jgi:sugar phosphate isomerase/epimerase
MPLTRRDFLATAGALPALMHGAAVDDGPQICLFSKHLPELNWRDLARNTRAAGFQGIDLTVRKAGHVLPERAPEDLPKAPAAIRDEGLTLPMITTEALSATPVARALFATAGRLSIPFLKPGYYYYKFVDIRRELDDVAKQFRELVALGREHGVQIGFHNHSGYVGAAVWDVARFMDGLDPKYAGYYFDVCHAVTEGGNSGWRIAANLVASRIKMIAVKDFYWEKGPQGWRARMCPLGEGMVPWSAYFKILAAARFGGPISLHLEYEIPGATVAARQENTLAAARRDLGFLRARLNEAV